MCPLFTLVYYGVAGGLGRGGCPLDAFGDVDWWFIFAFPAFIRVASGRARVRGGGLAHSGGEVLTKMYTKLTSCFN